MRKKLYIFIAWEDVEPAIVGPFKSDKERVKIVRNFRKDDHGENGYFRLDIKDGKPSSRPFINWEVQP